MFRTHYSFDLHDLPSQTLKRRLSGKSGVYKLVLLGGYYTIRTTAVRTIVQGDLLRVGISGDLYSRLNNYRNANSGNAEFDDWLSTDFDNDVRVRVYFTSIERARTIEANEMLNHAQKPKRRPRKRIPMFNTRGEFSTACDCLGKCLTPETRALYTQPWESLED